MIIFTFICCICGDDSLFLCTLLRHKGLCPQSQSVVSKNGFEDDPDLTAQLHQTLVDFEADLAGEGVCQNICYIGQTCPGSPGVYISNTEIEI